MRAYSLNNSIDGMAYDCVVANNIKEAKKLMMENQKDWIIESETSFIEYYAKWNKKANIKDLKSGDFIEGIELIKRNIVSMLNYQTCPKCKKEDKTIYLQDDNSICCEDCE